MKSQWTKIGCILKLIIQYLHLNSTQTSNTKMAPIKAQMRLECRFWGQTYFFWWKKKWWKDEEDRCNSAKVLLNKQTGQKQLCLQKFLQMTLKWKISYILVKALMANFHFWGSRIIFWRGHSPKSWNIRNFRIFFTPMTPSKNDPVSPKLKISH